MDQLPLLSHPLPPKDLTLLAALIGIELVIGVHFSIHSPLLPFSVIQGHERTFAVYIRRPLPKALYFTVRDLKAIYDRARVLRCLSTEEGHDARGGGILVRQWSEWSFYVEDPWKNPLCFVEEGTVYTG
jgi:hypothetical protein